VLVSPLKTTQVVVALAATPFFAQESEQYLICDEKANTQREMLVCASEEAKRVDAELNDMYRMLLKNASNDAEAINKIKKAERAWISYRDAYIEAMYPADDKQTQYGSIFPMQANLLRAKLTREHLDDVKALVEQYAR